MPLSGKDFIKLLKKSGWKLSRIKGSHYIMEKDIHTLTVPVHGNKSLGKGLENKLFKLSGVKKK